MIILIDNLTIIPIYILINNFRDRLPTKYVSPTEEISEGKLLKLLHQNAWLNTFHISRFILHNNITLLCKKVMIKLKEVKICRFTQENGCKTVNRILSTLFPFSKSFNITIFWSYFAWEVWKNKFTFIHVLS